jgi:hypothetical protein
MRDDELQRALKRVDPPAGFAGRVLARASRQEPGAPKQPEATKAGAPLTWAIAATIVLATIGGGSVWYRAEERRREQGEEAKRQVLVSLSLAGSKLRSIEMKVNRGEER